MAVALAASPGAVEPFVVVDLIGEAGAMSARDDDATMRLAVRQPRGKDASGGIYAESACGQRSVEHCCCSGSFRGLLDGNTSNYEYMRGIWRKV